jgi:hypothetical protein
MTFFETLKKRWYVFIAIIGIFIFLLSWFGNITIFEPEHYSRIYLHEQNESFVPQGYIIHLTDEDFKVFPKLIPVIRDKNQKPLLQLENGEREYSIFLTGEEHYLFEGRYQVFDPSIDMTKGIAFEYKGKYYGFVRPAIN